LLDNRVGFACDALQQRIDLLLRHEFFVAHSRPLI
jgi:hypothetical protein